MDTNVFFKWQTMEGEKLHALSKSFFILSRMEGIDTYEEARETYDTAVEVAAGMIGNYEEAVLVAPDFIEANEKSLIDMVKARKEVRREASITAFGSHITEYTANYIKNYVGRNPELIQKTYTAMRAVIPECLSEEIAEYIEFSIQDDTLSIHEPRSGELVVWYLDDIYDAMAYIENGHVLTEDERKDEFPQIYDEED